MTILTFIALGSLVSVAPLVYLLGVPLPGRVRRLRLKVAELERPSWFIIRDTKFHHQRGNVPVLKVTDGSRTKSVHSADTWGEINALRSLLRKEREKTQPGSGTPIYPSKYQLSNLLAQRSREDEAEQQRLAEAERQFEKELAR